MVDTRHAPGFAEGLKREIKVVVPAQEMQGRMNERLAEVKEATSAAELAAESEQMESINAEPA